jgi:hypothetical protein
VLSLFPIWANAEVLTNPINSRFSAIRKQLPDHDLRNAFDRSEWEGVQIEGSALLDSCWTLGCK